MPHDHPGIDNQEFYSGYYLQAVLEGDLASLFARWKAEVDAGTRARAPFDELAGLAERWFAANADAEDTGSDLATRLDAAQAFHAHLLPALGYTRAPAAADLDGEALPIALEIRRSDRPYLWVCEAPFPAADADDPLGATPLAQQLPPDLADTAKLPRAGSRHLTWREILDERVFRSEHGPRWVLMLTGGEVWLAERGKWGQGQYLRFDLAEILGRREKPTLRATAALLHRESLAGDDDACLHDELDENSHKHAFAVSADLQYGVRRAVELLANEAVHHRREKRQGVFNLDDDFAADLTQDCLVYLYRLLFLFYVEARGAELGAVPMRSSVYRDGYSLESLRELELVRLETDQARNGTFLHESLKRLFRLVDAGFGPEVEEFASWAPDGFAFDAASAGADDATDTASAQPTSYHDTFRVDGLHSPLFDDDRLRYLGSVTFRNSVLQEVIQLLSLSAERKGKARGRISYAQLGVNQLGAVYEGLLSYTGFFATEELYEVAKKSDVANLAKPEEREKVRTFFVPASRIEAYDEDEFVRDADGKRVVHPKGTYLFRLAGRNREKSASYYTPEVLTRCLVKYALRELLYHPQTDEELGRAPLRFKVTADEILELSICEPAMGSGAFLAEAVDQLADAYLVRRQEEIGQRLASEDYARHKRRVKARLATNNCYGVDLNPVAAELAKVSLWLATLHEGGKCPWFGLRLAAGNSLVGARREVYDATAITSKGTKAEPNWLGMSPEPVPFRRADAKTNIALDPTDPDWSLPERPTGTIHHFLLPADGMAPFDGDKVVRQLAEDETKRIKAWRKAFCKPFTKADAKRLVALSDAVDELWAEVCRERALAIAGTDDRVPVWGEEFAGYAEALGAEEPGPAGADGAAADDEESVVGTRAADAGAGVGYDAGNGSQASGTATSTASTTATDADDLVRERVARTRDARLNPRVQDQEALAAALEDTSSAFRRLKLVMDAWCALWFWPIRDARALPSREEWLATLELVLVGTVAGGAVERQREMAFDGADGPSDADGDDAADEAAAHSTDTIAAAAEPEPSYDASSAAAARAIDPLELPRAAGLDDAVSWSAAGVVRSTEPVGPAARLRRVALELEARRAASGGSLGTADVAEIVRRTPWLGIVERVAERQRFHHWQLRFAEVFASRGGFDLILGNPPWIKLQWNEKGLLSDYDPSLEIRGVSASETAKRRERILEAHGIEQQYLDEFEGMEGAQAFLGATANYAGLRGIQSNVYKNFLVTSWRNGDAEGVVGLLHPEGVYDDPKGGALREELYPRLAAHFQFVNEFSLFAEVDHHAKYSLNVYQGGRGAVDALQMSNVFHPRTVDASIAHDGHGPTPGYKTEQNEFEVTGHRNRVIRIGEDELALFARLYDDAGTRALRARLPVVHSREVLRVLERFAEQPRRLGDLQGEYFATEMWHETNEQKSGTLRRETRHPKDASEWILQGPHFFVGTPFNKTPNEGCRNNLDYRGIDLTAIGDDYLPRTNYVPACSPAEYASRTPKWNGRLVTEFYRHVNRKMLAPTGERTLVPSIVPPGVSHVMPVVSAAFSSLRQLVDVSSLLVSLPLDFYLKSTGKSDLTTGGLKQLPLAGHDDGRARLRLLRLVCLTRDFAGLWEESFSDEWSSDAFATPDARIGGLSEASVAWRLDVGLRSDLIRRQALVELDVLASLAFNLELDELLTIYRAQFPVLQQYERERRYDQHGRIVPTSTTCLGEDAVNLVALAGTLAEQAGFDPAATYRPGSSELEELLRQPVHLKKRDAAVLGVSERCTMADLLAETPVRLFEPDHPANDASGARIEPLWGLRYTDPGLEPRLERVYPTPWTRCDREADYRRAWGVLGA